MKTGILFDLDGTLLDTLEDIHDAVNYALHTLNYPKRSMEEVRRFVGNGARLLMERAVPEDGDGQAAFEVFRAYYDSHCQIRTRPYAGIPEALSALKEKYPIAIVSNKPHSAVVSLCAGFFPGICARGESVDCPRKPAPDMLYKTMAQIGVEKCIYVGDSEVDVLTAKNAGVRVLSVLWGFRDREELEKAGAEAFCESAHQLVETIEQMTT